MAPLSINLPCGRETSFHRLLYSGSGKDSFQKLIDPTVDRLHTCRCVPDHLFLYPSPIQKKAPSPRCSQNLGKGPSMHITKQCYIYSRPFRYSSIGIGLEGGGFVAGSTTLASYFLCLRSRSLFSPAFLLLHAKALSIRSPSEVTFPAPMPHRSRQNQNQQLEMIPKQRGSRRTIKDSFDLIWP